MPAMSRRETWLCVLLAGALWAVLMAASFRRMHCVIERTDTVTTQEVR